MRTHPAALVLPLALLVAGALSGCIPTDASPTATPGASSSPSRSGSPSDSTATPSATASASPEVIPFSVACSSLLADDTMYAFDPNFSLLETFEPDAGSLAAEVLAAGGTACRWIHGTSSVTLDVAVADLPTDAVAARTAQLDASGTAVGDYGDHGYFEVSGGAGQAQRISGSHWVTVVSPMFSSPSDAAGLMGSVVGTLP